MSQTPSGQINGSDPDQLVERTRALEAENQELKQKIFDHYEWSREKRKELLTEIEGLRSISVEYAILNFFCKRIESSTGLTKQAIELGLEKTKISLVVAPARISRGIDRLFDDLASQEHKHFELVLVTAEETSNSKGVDLRVVKVSPNAPLSARVRAGFASSSGDVLGYIRDYSRLVPSSLTNVVLFFSQNPDVQISHGARIRADAAGLSLLETPIWLDFRSVQKDQNFSEFFFRRNAFDFIAAIDSQVEEAWEFAAVLRLLLRYPSRLNPRIVKIDPVGRDSDLAPRAIPSASSHRVISLVQEQLRTPKWVWKRSLGALEYVRAKAFDRSNLPLWFPVQSMSERTPREQQYNGIIPPVDPILEDPVDRFLFTLRTTGRGEEELFNVFLHSSQKIAAIAPFRSGDSQESSHTHSHFQQVDWTFSPFVTPRARHLQAIGTQCGLTRQKQMETASYSDRITSLQSLIPASGRVLDFRGCFQWAKPFRFPDHAVDVVTDWQGWLTTIDYHALDKTPLGKPWEYDVLFQAIHLPGILQVCTRPRHLLRVLATLLQTQGLLIVSTPNLDSTQLQMFGPAWEHWQPATNAYIYSVSALRKLLKHCGFREIRFETFSDDSWSKASQDRLLAKTSDGGKREARPVRPSLGEGGNVKRSSPLAGDMILGVFSKIY